MGHPDFDDDTEEFDFLVAKLGGWVSVSRYLFFDVNGEDKFTLSSSTVFG